MIYSNYLNRNDIAIINAKAKIYNKTLNNKELLFCYDNGGELDGIHTCFKAENFPHLLGIKSALSGSKRISANQIFQKALNGCLRVEDCDFSRSRILFEKKCAAFQTVANIAYQNHVIGSFDETKHRDMRCDVIVNKRNVNLGFIETANNIFFPCSVVQAPLNNMILPRSSKLILATFQKSYNKHRGHVVEQTFLSKTCTLEQGNEIYDLANQMRFKVPYQTISDNIHQIEARDLSLAVDSRIPDLRSKAAEANKQSKNQKHGSGKDDRG